jgi:AcrR family transcriptional regulator
VGRPAKFDSGDILDAAARLVAAGGPSSATVANIASDLGAPTGSIYHRFESRELIMARLWICAVKAAQVGFIDALGLADLDEGARAAALHIPRWSRRHLELAQVLVLHRREDLVGRWPAELGHELDGLNADLEAALRSFTARWSGRMSRAAYGRVVFALVDVPYGAVRRHLLAGQPPPREVDDLVGRTCACILGAGP